MGVKRGTGQAKAQRVKAVTFPQKSRVWASPPPQDCTWRPLAWARMWGVSTQTPHPIVVGPQIGFRGTVGGTDEPAQGPLGIPRESLKAIPPISPIFLGRTRPKIQSSSGLHSSHPPHPVSEQAVTAIPQNPLQSDPHHHPHCHPVSSSSLVLPTHPCCLLRALQWSGGILMN